MRHNYVKVFGVRDKETKQAFLFARTIPEGNERVKEARRLRDEWEAEGYRVTIASWLKILGVQQIGEDAI